MFAWLKVPLLRVIIPFIFGVILGINIQYERNWIFVLIFIQFFVINVINLKIIDHRILIRLDRIHGLLISMLIFCCGYALTVTKIQINQKCHYTHHISDNSLLIAKIIEIPEVKHKTVKLILKIKYVADDKTINRHHGKALVFVHKDSISGTLKYGDFILFTNKLRDIDPPQNPGQFNYKKFLYYKQIYRQGFLREGDWQVMPDHKKLKLFTKIINLRVQIVNAIQERIDNPDESAIATALLAGYKVELSDQVKESFSSTGAMHVLAVSGLHVGIIFVVFNFLLRPLKRIKYGHIFMLIAMLFLLWMYAILTGLSPSVCRAATMFSFVIIGQNIRRLTNIYSSIITSLLVLLIIDPFLISQVGFQLSYAAVIGIVYIQPKIQELWKIKNWLGRQIWSLFAVSIAAQIATLPLGLYYFNQFPVYFFVSNLIVIPLATLILYSGLAFLICFAAGAGFFTDAFAFLLKWLVHFLNESVLLIRELPGGLISEIYLSNAGLLFLYSAIIFFVFYLVNKKGINLILCLLMILCFACKSTIWKIQNYQNSHIVIYAINNHSLIGFFDYKQLVFYGDSSIINDSSTIKYNTHMDLWSKGIYSKDALKLTIGDSFQNENLKINNGFIQFHNIKLLVTDDNKLINKSIDQYDFDYLIFTNSPFIYFDSLKNNIKCNMVIADKSNKFYVRDIWEMECKKRNIDYFDMGKSGSFFIDVSIPDEIPEK